MSPFSPMPASTRHGWQPPTSSVSPRTPTTASSPRVVFSDPEIAAVGLTEQQATEQGIDPVSASLELPNAIARPWTYEEHPRGWLGLVADGERQVLVGPGRWLRSPVSGSMSPLSQSRQRYRLRPCET